MFELCWDESKGFSVAVDRLPDRVLEWFMEWRHEKIEAENQKMRDKGLVP